MTKRERILASARPATRAVHSGEHLDLGPAKPTVSPIHLSTSYVFESTGDLDAVFDDPAEGFAYGRFGNPSVRALEKAIAAVENSDAAIAYPSGMAAINGVLQLFAKPGDHVVVSRDVYGATLTLLQTQFAAIGVTPHFVDVTDLEATKALVDDVSPTLLLAETISNPLIKVADLKALAGIAHARGARFIVDNTFASPALVIPTDLGADLTLHSTTKYIAGHGDVLGGVVAGPAESIRALRDLARINGAVPAGFDAWLTLRGLKTLHLRMREHSANARAVVEWMKNDPRITRIHYPDANDPATKDQFLGDDRGGMIGFEVRGMGKREAWRYLEALTIVEPATTLGDVSSLSLYPAGSSHRGLTPEQRAEWDIGDDLIRLSVGIEDVRDIIDDIDQALAIALGQG